MAPRIIKSVYIGKLVIGKVKTCIVEFFDSEILNISTYPQSFADETTLYFSSSFPRLKVRFPICSSKRQRAFRSSITVDINFKKKVNVHAGIWIENYGTKKYLINYYVKLTFKSHSIMHSIHCDSILL